MILVPVWVVVNVVKYPSVIIIGRPRTKYWTEMWLIMWFDVMKEVCCRYSWVDLAIFLDVDQFYEMHKNIIEILWTSETYKMSWIGSKSRLTKTKIFTSLLSEMLTCIIIPINLPFERNQLGYFLLQKV